MFGIDYWPTIVIDLSGLFSEFYPPRSNPGLGWRFLSSMRFPTLFFPGLSFIPKELSDPLERSFACPLKLRKEKDGSYENRFEALRSG
jgi:hypothetical protein